MPPRPRRSISSTSAAIVLSDSDNQDDAPSTRVTPEEGVSAAASPSTAPTSIRGVAKVAESEGERDDELAMELDEAPTPCVPLITLGLATERSLTEFGGNSRRTTPRRSASLAASKRLKHPAQVLHLTESESEVSGSEDEVISSARRSAKGKGRAKIIDTTDEEGDAFVKDEQDELDDDDDEDEEDAGVKQVRELAKKAAALSRQMDVAGLAMSAGGKGKAKAQEVGKCISRALKGKGKAILPPSSSDEDEKEDVKPQDFDIVIDVKRTGKGKKASTSRASSTSASTKGKGKARRIHPPETSDDDSDGSAFDPDAAEESDGDDDADSLMDELDGSEKSVKAEGESELDLSGAESDEDAKPKKKKKTKAPSPKGRKGKGKAKVGAEDGEEIKEEDEEEGGKRKKKEKIKVPLRKGAHISAKDKKEMKGMSNVRSFFLPSLASFTDFSSPPRSTAAPPSTSTPTTPSSSPSGTPSATSRRLPSRRRFSPLA